jgi:DNA-binding winged helix-turn-helix (wHTH) protein/tetratricopeptide (TPR) repeat protein
MLKTAYRFGKYQLDPRYRTLHCDGELVALPLKSFECLAYLVEHRDRAVGRDELIAAVWGSADINDHTLAQTLSRVRQALRDTDGDTAWIRTVPRFGYCWVAPTERAEVDLENPSLIPNVLATTTSPSSPAMLEAAQETTTNSILPLPASRPKRRLFAGLAIVAALAVISIGVLQWRARMVPPNKAVPTSAVGAHLPSDGAFLVMPVLLDADRRETAWIRLGVMDYIGAALKESGAHRVLPNEQTLSLTAGAEQDGRLANGDLSRMMALTGATHVVQTHAEQSDGQWRFVLDVFEGATLRSYSGTAPGPLDAVRAALEPMLHDLNLTGTLARPSERDETLERIDAAMLIGDLAQVQQLLDANASLAAENPAFRQRVGQLALRRGRLDDATHAFRGLIDDRSDGVSDTLRAQAWNGLGGAELQRPDFAAAEAAYAESIALLHEGGDQQLLGNAYLGRGTSYANLKRFEEAMADFGRARVSLDRVGDRIGIARLDIDMAAADAYRGRLAQSLEAQDRAIHVLTAFGVRDQLLVALHNKLHVQLAMLDLHGAEETSRLALEQASRFDNERMRLRIAASRVRVLLALGQLAEAGRVIDRFDTTGQASDSEFAALRLEWLAQRGDYARAADLAMAAMDHIAGADGLASQAILPWACLSGVDAAVRVGRIDLADRLIARLARVPAAASDPENKVIADLSRALVLQARGRVAEAGAVFSASLAQAEREGDSGSTITVASMWLRTLLDPRDSDAAASIAGRLRSYADKDYVAARALDAYYRASGQPALAQESAGWVRALAGERDPNLPL